MSRRMAACLLAGLVIVGAGFLSQAISQTAPTDQGGRGNRGGNRTQRTPEEMRKMMTDRMKETLGVTNEDEWKVMEPKLEKVMTLSMQSRFGGGMMGMMGGRGNRGNRGGDTNATNPPPPPPANPNASEVQKKSEALTKVLANKEAKPEEIAAALTALREAKAAARAELEKAQKDLKEVLTARQEAQLVTFGMLD